MSQKRRRKELKRKKRQQKKKPVNEKKILTTDDKELLKWKTKRIEESGFTDGYDLENIVEKICLKIGLPDTVVVSPQYQDSKGIQKEICDLLVVCGRTLVVFQVKHRVLDGDKDQEVILNRAEKLITKLKSQFSTFIDLFEQDSHPDVKTQRGVEVEINKSDYDKVVLVGVVAYPGKSGFDKEKDFDLVNAYMKHRDYPLHVFDVDDFDKISLELDTPRDLITYFSLREKFFGEVNIGMTSELNLLAYFKMNPGQVEDAISDGVKITLDDGMWDYYTGEFGSKLIDRNAANAKSYVYDMVLDKVYESLGFQYPSLDVTPTYEPGTVKAYFQVINELANFNRVSRRSLGEAIEECLLRAEKNFAGNSNLGFAFRLIIDNQKEDSAIIFLSVVDGFMDRDKRVNFLHNLCITAQYKFGIKHTLGIATESLRCKLRSYDFISMGEHRFIEADDEKFGPMADDIWKSAPQNIRLHEFSE